MKEAYFKTILSAEAIEILKDMKARIAYTIGLLMTFKGDKDSNDFDLPFPIKLDENGNLLAKKIIVDKNKAVFLSCTYDTGFGLSGTTVSLVPTADLSVVKFIEVLKVVENSFKND